MESVVDDFTVYTVSEVKRVDFVLVYSTYGLKGTVRETRITEFLQNLFALGLDVKKVPSVVHPHIIFVLLKGTSGLLKKYADIYGFVLSYENPYYKKETHKGYAMLACRVNRMSVDDPEFSRAPDTYSGERPANITSSERIMVIFQILRAGKFGSSSAKHGIVHLLEKGVFINAYPLHDEMEKWTELGKLSDRQILSKYWANTSSFFKHQPLNLIEKYFGAEVAFYFAFLKHYSLTLWWAAAVGLLCFLYGVITISSVENHRSYEVCHSNITLCPACPNLKICKYKPLKSSCTYANINYILDNQATICFAVLISIWTTVSMELWKRRQASLAYRWNVFSAHIDISIRPEYELSAKMRRISPVTGLWEPYENARDTSLHLFVSYTVVILLAALVICVVIAIRFYIATMRLVLGMSKALMVRRYASIIAASTASTLSVIVMLIFENIYIHMAKILTNLENPRTEVQYDNSYIYKRFILTFINGYAVTFYVAFFQGRFYTHPGTFDTYGSHIQYDVCDPTGCTINLAIHLAVVLSIKSFLMNIVQVLKPSIAAWRKKKKSKKHENFKNLPVWEQQYSLPDLERFFLVDEYQEIALQYGFVAFFSAVFTLAPIFALLHALISIRVDSRKFIKCYKRPVPVRVSGLMAWEGIFKIITLIGVVINAFIVGFTMDFIPHQIYHYQRNRSTNYIESTLSLFDTDDYAEKQNYSHPKYCHYKGKRHPPSHPRKYTYRQDYWYELALRIGFVIIYEQIVFSITSIVAYAIPDVPRAIKEKIEFEKTKLLKKSVAIS